MSDAVDKVKERLKRLNLTEAQVARHVSGLQVARAKRAPAMVLERIGDGTMKVRPAPKSRGRWRPR
jgi:hypothetical protein